MLYGIVDTTPASEQVRRHSGVIDINPNVLDASGLDRFTRHAVHGSHMLLYVFGSYLFPCITPHTAAGTTTGFAATAFEHRPVTVAVDRALTPVADPWCRPAGPAGTLGVITEAATTWHPLVADGCGLLRPAPGAERPVAAAMWAETESLRRDGFRSITVACSPQLYRAVFAELGGEPSSVVFDDDTPIGLEHRLVLGGSVTVVPALDLGDTSTLSVIATRGLLSDGEVAQHTTEVVYA